MIEAGDGAPMDVPMSDEMCVLSSISLLAFCHFSLLSSLSSLILFTRSRPSRYSLSLLTLFTLPTLASQVREGDASFLAAPFSHRSGTPARARAWQAYHQGQALAASSAAPPGESDESDVFHEASRA